MIPDRHLGNLRYSLRRRLVALHRLALLTRALPFGESDRLIGYICLESLNSWSEFVRAYLLSVVLHPVSESGAVLTFSGIARTFDDVILAVLPVTPRKWALKYAKPPVQRRFEPPWHLPATMIDGGKVLGVSNATQIRGAFSISSGVFEDLATARHFYAHRNRSTAQRVHGLGLKYGIAAQRHPTDVLMRVALGRPQSILVDWLSDLRVVSELLCA